MSHHQMGISLPDGIRFAMARAEPSELTVRIRTLLLALLLITPSLAAAQLDPAVKIGARVRVHRADGVITGRLLEHRGDTIVVRPSPDDTSIALSLRDAAALKVYGRSRRAEMFANTVGGVAAASGAAVFVSWCLRDADQCRWVNEDEDPYDDVEPSPVIMQMVLGFGMAGMLLGYALTPPRWNTVPLPFRVGVAPTQDGLAVYLSVPAPRLTHHRR